nr:reverse transcriptase domain-containing protein [Tanacetum cinerariifolium]
LIQVPTEGYEDAIVISEIAANNFELKHGLINLVQNKQFFKHDKEDPHAHIRYFNKITSTMRVPNVSSSLIKLMLFPFSLEGAAWIWLEKEPPRSILTWDDLVSKFINQFFPPSKTTNLRNEIMRFQQRFDESFCEAWDHFNDLLRACPHHGFSELHQLDTFYNALNVNDQDSLNSAAGGNFLDKMPRECLKIIESKSKVRQSRAKAVVSTTRKTNPQLQFHLLLLLQLKQLSQIVLHAMILTRTKIFPLQAKTFIDTASKRMDECLALTDLGASINLMPLFVWEALSLLELTPTCMTLELADRSVSKPIGIAKDVSFKVGVFHFPAEFVVVDFEPDPRVPLILGRYFLRTNRALVDVHKGELTLRIENEAITYNLDQTVRYSANYNQMTANKIDVIEMACEEYSQEVLGFSDVTTSGNPTPHDDPIVSITSPTLTLFGDSDFLLFEEADAFLGLEDDSTSSKINPFYYDPEGDILLLEAILNSAPLPPLLNHEQYLPTFKTELEVCEAKTVKSFIDEPPEVELKDLPPHLEYAFLEGDNKFPVIIAKELGDEEKSALIKVRLLLSLHLGTVTSYSLRKPMLFSV